MAHTPRAGDEKRKHPQLYPLGTAIGMHTDKGMAEGKITSHDEGGWIYVSWYNSKGMGSLPGYLRSTNVFKLPKSTKSGLAFVKEQAQKTHDNSSMLPMRYGYVDKETSLHFATGGGCFAGIAGPLCNSMKEFVYAVTHGDGANLSFEALSDNDIFNEELMAYKHPSNVYQGTPRSREWVEFLLSEKSPWQQIRPFVAEKDVDFCNNAAFIFTNIAEMPKKLAYNLVMAIRYPWEMPRQFTFWRLLNKAGCDPAVAAFLSNFIQPAKGAKDIDGPYDIIYPWSFLESARLDCASRFITGTPGDVSPRVGCSPNVFPLWQINSAENKKAWSAFESIEKLDLTAAYKFVKEAMERH